MLPIVKVPVSIQEVMKSYRNLFVRDAGFEHICRYVTGLLISANKTLQGIYDLQRWEGNPVSCRAMHQSIFESGWKSEQLMSRHRKVVSQDYRQGQSVISLDWTLSHHEKGSHIYGVKKGFDYIEKRYGLFQTVVTATASNERYVDGVASVIQAPGFLKEEEVYLKGTSQAEYQNTEEARKRLLELLHYHQHQLQYRKRTEICVDIVREIEEEGHFPQAHYAFDNGVLHLELIQLIEGKGKHWVSELEVSRNVCWESKWLRMDQIAEMLRTHHPQSFRKYEVPMRCGTKRTFWAFSKILRLKNGYGKKRIVIVHETQNLSDSPRFLITDAFHWEPTKIMTIWSYRWSSEIFHEFSKQQVGFEDTQVRKEEAVKRAFHLSCVAQSILQRQQPQASTSEKFKFAQGQITVGQKQRSLVREVFKTVISLIQKTLASGESPQQILDRLMPA